MPVIFQQKIDSSVSVCVWHITETEESLFCRIPFSEEDIDFILSYKLEKRRKEQLACRLALYHLLAMRGDHAVYKLRYTQSGAPYIDNYFISFSHSGSYVAVMLSSSVAVGIDIQRLDDRIKKLYPRFMNDGEISRLPDENSEILHYYWCAKECMIKLFGEKEVDFRDKITVMPSLQEPIAAGEFDGTHIQARLYHNVTDNFMLVMAVKTL